MLLRNTQIAEPRGRLLLRCAGLAVGLMIGLTLGRWLIELGNPSRAGSTLFTIAVAIAGIGYLLGPHLSWRLFRTIRDRVMAASVIDLVATGLGLAFGAIVSVLLAVPLSYLPGELGTFLPVVFAALSCTLGVVVANWRKAELVEPWMPKPAAVTAEPGCPGLLVDTNVLIDGRIINVLATGLLSGKLFVPRFVIDELQRIADNDDPVRRQRGRRGLDTLHHLRSACADRFVVLDDLVLDEREVDAKLTRLARDTGARMLTNDYNLDKVARLHGVEVLNLNAVAKALRPMVNAGDVINLKLTQEGREAGQGVGFLDDGTMIVVDGGSSLVGQQVPVTVTRTIQTGSGRLIFAILKHAA